MKKVALLSFMLSLAFGGFEVTPMTYGAYEDFDAICKSFFGPKAQLADWSQIKQAYDKVKDKEEFIRSLGLIHYDQSLIIKNGSHFFEEGDRHFILTLHNGSVYSTYLVHNTIDAHTLDLGSWRDLDYPALCIVK